MPRPHRTFLQALACALTLTLSLSAELARAFVTVPTPCVIKAVTIPVPTSVHPGYCFAAPVIEIDHVPGATTYRETYKHVDSGTIGSNVGVPPDFVFVNLSGQGGTLHPAVGKHWVVLGGSGFGTTCALAASYVSDDWTDPHCEGRVPDDQRLTAALEFSKNPIGPDVDFIVTLTVTNATNGTLTGIDAPAALTLGGANPDIVEKKSGPDPGDAVTLAAGANQAFTYVYHTKSKGAVQFSATVDGLNASLQNITSNTATADLTVESTLTLDATATAPQSNGASVGDVIHYALDAKVSDQASQLVVKAKVQLDLVDINVPTITPGSVLVGDTITWTLTNTKGTTPPLGFDVTVKPSIPDSITTIPMEAEAHATLEAGGTLDATDNAGLTLLRNDVRLSITPVTTRPGKAKPGEEVRYQVHAKVGADTKTLTVDVAIPVGTKLVPGSVTQGGKAKGKRVQWTFSNTAEPPTLEYRVTVAALTKLKEQRQLDVDAKADAVLTTDEKVNGVVTHTLPIAVLLVAGKVTDAIMPFPANNNVNVNQPLGGVEIRLLRGTDVVSEATTNKKGQYEIAADDDGMFTLEFRKKADVYSHFSNSIATASRAVLQKRQVTLLTPQLVPHELDVILPVGVVNRAAATLHKLNNFPVPLFSGAIKTNLLQMFYDTAAEEAFVEQLIADAPEFPGVFAGAGPRDHWNGLIRNIAFWAVAATRTDDVIALADDAGKTLALLVTVEVLKKLGQKKLISAPGDSLAQLAAQRLRIGVMVGFVGTALPLILDQLHIEGQKKAIYIQIAASFLRFGANKWTGQFTDDLLFELIFDVLRTTVVVVTTGELFGASSNATSLLPDRPIVGRTGVQTLLDDMLEAAKSKRYGGNTLQALTEVNDQNDLLKQSFTRVHLASIAALQVFGVFRGVKGIFEKGDKIEFKSGTSYQGRAKEAQALLGKIAKPVTLLSYGAAIEGIGHPLLEVDVQLKGTQKLADAALQLPLRSRAAGGVDGMREASAKLGAILANARTLAATDKKRAKTVIASPAVTAYLDVVSRLSKALKTKDDAVITAIRNEQVAADAAVFTDYLDPLRNQVEAALPTITDATLSAQLFAFIDSEMQASTQCGLYYLQLDIRDEYPAEAGKSPVDKQAKLCTTALLAADGAATSALATTSDIATAGHLVITGGDPPAQLHAGDHFELAFTVTNVGDAGLAAGTATLATPGDHVVVSGPHEQALPALAPGASVTLTWQVAAPAIPEAVFASYQLEVNPTVGNPALFTDFVLIQP